MNPSNYPLITMRHLCSALLYSRPERAGGEQQGLLERGGQWNGSARINGGFCPPHRTEASQTEEIGPRASQCLEASGAVVRAGWRGLLRHACPSGGDVGETVGLRGGTKGSVRGLVVEAEGHSLVFRVTYLCPSY